MNQASAAITKVWVNLERLQQCLQHHWSHSLYQHRTRILYTHTHTHTPTHTHTHIVSHSPALFLFVIPALEKNSFMQ